MILFFSSSLASVSDAARYIISHYLHRMASFPSHFCPYLWRCPATHFRSFPTSISAYNRFQRLVLSERLRIYLSVIYLFAHSNGLRSLLHGRINIRLNAIDLFRRCLFILMRMFIQPQLCVAINAGCSRDAHVVVSGLVLLAIVLHSPMLLVDAWRSPKGDRQKFNSRIKRGKFISWGN